MAEDTKMLEGTLEKLRAESRGAEERDRPATWNEVIMGLLKMDAEQTAKELREERDRLINLHIKYELMAESENIFLKIYGQIMEALVRNSRDYENAVYGSANWQREELRKK